MCRLRCRVAVPCHCLLRTSSKASAWLFSGKIENPRAGYLVHLARPPRRLHQAEDAFHERLTDGQEEIRSPVKCVRKSVDTRFISRRLDTSRSLALHKRNASMLYVAFLLLAPPCLYVAKLMACPMLQPDSIFPRESTRRTCHDVYSQ